MDDEHGIPWWLWPILFCVGILVLGSIDDQPNDEPYVGICNRPTVQQAC
ncbi:MAG TPA: hypothetical protein VFX15_03665 [Actinomycetes bacterium]|nr:hypothetical protein [Actinomycetes bacterium]